jgi:hypothetical protein
MATSTPIVHCAIRTARRSRNSAGTGLTSRVACHVDVAAETRRDRVVERWRTSAIAMIAAMIADRYASDG